MRPSLRPLLIPLAATFLAIPGTVFAAFEFVGEFGQSGTAPGQFDAPRGVAIDNSDRIVLTESGNHRVQICSATGACTAWGSFGVESGEFDRPRGLGVNSTGRIFIADRGNDRVQNCGSTGICTDFGGSGTVVGKFESPRGIALTADDRIVVTDTDNNRVQVCSEDGSCTAFGSLGSATGQFNSPAGVAVDSNGRLIISDRGNDRIQVCSLQGACTAFGSFGSGLGQFDSPAGIAVDSRDRIVIVDRFNDRIQVCDDTGDCEAFGSTGAGPGQFDLPWGVAVDSRDRIVVADLGNDRIQIFAEAGVPAIEAFSASPGTIAAGESVLLSWTVSGATACTPLNGTPGWRNLAIDPAGGSASLVINNEGDRTFTLECSNANGSVRRSVVVSVTPAGDPFVINAGLNDAWFSPEVPFQGFFFTVFEDLGLFFLAWFTFDSVLPDEGVSAVFGAAGHRWLTALGSFSGNSVTLQVELTTGGIFNQSQPEPDQQPDYGTITIEFSGCNSAELVYDLPAAGVSGSQSVSRVVGDNIALCQALASE